MRERMILVDKDSETSKEEHRKAIEKAAAAIGKADSFLLIASVGEDMVCVSSAHGLDILLLYEAVDKWKFSTRRQLIEAIAMKGKKE